MNPAAPDFSAFDPMRVSEQLMGFWNSFAKPAPPPSPMAAFAQMFAPQTPAAGFDPFAQAQQAFARMQQGLLPMLQGQGMDAESIARAWQQMLGDSPLLPAQLFAPFLGAGAPGGMPFAAFSPGAAAELRGALDTVPLGLMREHQQRLQAYAQAQLDLSSAFERYNAVLQQIQRDGLQRFEAKLKAHSAPGQQLESARALFDLWVDASEEAFAEAASGAEYRHAFAEFTNAQMRLRQCGQALMEQQLRALGLPSRDELDSAHKRAYEMQKELRALKQRVAELELIGQGGSAAPTDEPRRDRAESAKETVTAKSAPAKKAAPKRKTAKKPSAKAAKSTVKASAKSKSKARRKPLAPLADVSPKAPARRRKGA
jgi:class III poly(R)-hydroxyalkanoic acid synthase PhaE subunit